MGWYLRKSLRLGPVRFNLSKSGVGYSVGVRGARIGIDPRGRQYIRLGRGGVYYQKYLSPSPAAPSVSISPSVPPAISQDSELAEVVQTAGVAALQDSNATELLQEINARYSRAKFAPLVVVLTAIATVFALAYFPLWASVSLVVLGSIAYAFATRADYERKVLHLDYALDGQASTAYVSLLQGFEEFQTTGALWRITSGEINANTKYHAGAGYSVKRTRISLGFQPPPFISTEMAIFQINTKSQKLFFLPDRILVYEGSQVGSLLYSDLECAISAIRFVENEQVPFDTKIIGTTWRYTNKNGGPDRRFSNNPQIPVVEYAQIGLRSSSGMNYLLEASSLAKAEALVRALAKYKNYLNSEVLTINPARAETPGKSMLFPQI